MTSNHHSSVNSPEFYAHLNGQFVLGVGLEQYGIDLKTRRKNSRLVSMFKILNELVEIPINDRLIPADRRTRGGHNQAYKHLRANTTLGQNSFWHRTIPDWNSLPAAAIESKTVAAFKSQLVD